MRLFRHVMPVLLGALWAGHLGAQDNTGAVSGKVTDATTQLPISDVEVSIVGTPHRTLTRNDGTYLLTGLATGGAQLRATRIGYGPVLQNITVAAGSPTAADITMTPAAAILEAVVATGYGTQRREAITGSVSTVSAAAANVGVTTNADQMLRGRAAGVEVTQNNGEPGAGSQILIRGGSSISNTNAPLYVIDGVPIYNEPSEAGATGLVGAPPLQRDPLNMLNPSDIESITILKDASATAIYGVRAANGVILIETKKARSGGGPTVEYDSYVAAASPARKLDVLTGDQFRTFVQQRVALYATDSVNGLAPSHLAALGTANTNWANAISRTGITHNHDLAFTGGSQDTRYRASINYMKQDGVTIADGLERIQGRLTGSHSDLNDRLRLNVNVTTSRVNNKYIQYENTGGFEGGVFMNAVIFNPTQPIQVSDTTGTHYFEFVGSTSVRNPVAMARELSDFGTSTRTLGNGTAEFDFAQGVTGQVTVGFDQASGLHQFYAPLSSPVGQQAGGGFAQQSTTENTTRTLQTLLTVRRTLGLNTLDVVGGYEYSKFGHTFFQATGKGFNTDANGFDNLNSAASKDLFSDASQSVLASFFTRANFGFKDRFFVTGILRYDGSSKFAQGHQWDVFPGLSASWHLSQESFMRGKGPFSDLRIRAGWGRQGNPGIPPYQSLLLLQGSSGASYPWGDTPQTGYVAVTNPNKNLKWETSTQFNLGADFSLWDSKLAGTVDYYNKNTSDLLFYTDCAAPCNVSQTLSNIGKIRNNGIEATLDAVMVSHPGLSWRTGIVFASEHNKVLALPTAGGIPTGNVSGQGQSGQTSQRLLVGQSLGTFYGPVFEGWDANGRQLFKCSSGAFCVGGKTTSDHISTGDYAILGNANPDFTLGVHSAINWRKFDISFLVRANIGQDVFNATALVYSTKGNALQDKGFLASALTDPTGIHEPAVFSSRWIEHASFLRMQNVTVTYDLDLPVLTRSSRSAKIYVSADNLFLITGYSGLDPEVSNLNSSSLTPDAGIAARGIDYLTYPRARTITGGLRLTF